MTTSTHEIGPSNQRCGEHRSVDIVIGAGTWLGAGVTVLPGVSIGAGSIVAVGSLVTRDLAPDGLYAGTPARLIRALKV